MDINCGDAFDSIITMASRSLGINHYFAESLGPPPPPPTPPNTRGRRRGRARR
jgi:hypothetical protein